MKTKQYLFGTMLFCASAAFISCSSDDDDFTSPSQEEGLTTITVGAPTIEPDGASKTRVAFEYSSGLNMSWQTDDKIRIKPSNVNAQKYTATGSGPTTTFTGPSFTDPTAPYTITLGSTYDSGNTETKANISNWATGKTVEANQTQSGNDNTAHLHRNYQALLDGVNTIENITFSQAWATAHENSTGSGVFKQSSCLKLDLTLPINANLTAIEKILLIVKDSGGNSAKVFSIKNEPGDNDGYKASQLTLNFSGLTSIDGNVKKYNLVGYIMLAANDVVFPANSTLTVRVYYNNSKYISKTKTFTSATTLSTGTLGVIKLNSENW